MVTLITPDKSEAIILLHGQVSISTSKDMDLYQGASHPELKGTLTKRGRPQRITAEVHEPLGMSLTISMRKYGLPDESENSEVGYDEEDQLPQLVVQDFCEYKREVEMFTFIWKGEHPCHKIPATIQGIGPATLSRGRSSKGGSTPGKSGLCSKQAFGV